MHLYSIIRYFEGKEYMNQFKPGKISATLKEALEHTEPPPWLFAMQRYGPPPSYPQLVIPGVNAPIPKGAEWGFKRGQWGHPPVDEVLLIFLSSKKKVGLS